MPYVLTSTLDRSVKGLYNRSVVILKKVNLMTDWSNISNVLSIEIETIDGSHFEIGPRRDYNNKQKTAQLKFPIKLQFIENTFQIQGETLGNQIVYVDFREMGHIDKYVSITRVRSVDQLKIIHLDYDNDLL